MHPRKDVKICHSKQLILDDYYRFIISILKYSWMIDNLHKRISTSYHLLQKYYRMRNFRKWSLKASYHKHNLRVVIYPSRTKWPDYKNELVVVPSCTNFRGSVTPCLCILYWWSWIMSILQVHLVFHSLPLLSIFFSKKDDYFKYYRISPFRKTMSKFLNSHV